MCIYCTKEKTMPCKECKNKTCLITGKPCPRVEKLLTQMSVGKLPNTISLDGNYFDKIVLKTIRGYDFIRDKQG